MTFAIPRMLVPNDLVLTSAENNIGVIVGAAGDNPRWYSFTNGGWYQQFGAGAVTNNSWTGDYWVNVVEKAMAYYTTAEVLEL